MSPTPERKQICLRRSYAPNGVNSSIEHDGQHALVCADGESQRRPKIHCNIFESGMRAATGGGMNTIRLHLAAALVLLCAAAAAGTAKHRGQNYHPLPARYDSRQPGLPAC